MIELLAAHFILCHKLPVTRQIGLRFDVIRFRLADLRYSRLIISLCGGDLRLRHSDIGFRRGDVGTRAGNGSFGADVRDRNVGLLDLHLGFRLHQSGLRLRHRNVIIAWIEFGQKRSRLHELVVCHVDGLELAPNATGNGVDIAIHLRIVGGFIGIQILLEQVAADTQCSDQNKRDQNADRVFAQLLTERLFRLLRFFFLRLLLLVVLLLFRFLLLVGFVGHQN